MGLKKGSILKLLSAGSMASLMVMSLGSLGAYAASNPLYLTVTVNGQPVQVALPAAASTPGLHETELTATVSGQAVLLPAVEYVVNAAGTSATVVTSTAPSAITVSVPSGAPSGTPIGIEATFTPTAGGSPVAESIPVSDFNSATNSVTFDPLGNLPLGDYTLAVAFTYAGTPTNTVVSTSTNYTASTEAVPGGITALNTGAVSVAANGTVAETFTVTDATGTPIAGVPVNFSVGGSLTAGDLQATSGVTNANGQVTAVYSDPTVGDTGAITATVAANPSLTATAGTITVVPATPASVTTSLPNGGNITAMQPVSITFTVLTASGVPVPDATLSLTLAGGLAGQGTLSNATPKTGNNGTATVTFTPNEAANGQTISGTIDAVVQGYPSATGMTGTLTVVNQAPAGITAQALSATVPAGGSQTLSFQVTDKSGQPLPGVPVTFSVTGSLNPANLQSTSAVSNNSGWVTVTYANDTQAGLSGTVVATTAGYPGYSADTALTVTAGAAAQISVGPTTGSEMVGSVYSAPVYLTDQYGNPVSGTETIQVYGTVFQPAPGGAAASFGAASDALAPFSGTNYGVPTGTTGNTVALTFSNGSATLYFEPELATSGMADNLGVSLPGTSGPLDSQVSVTPIYVSDAGATPATVTSSQPSATSLTAGQWDSITFTVRASDGNVVPNVPVAFRTLPPSGSTTDQFSAAGATLGALTGTTNSSGQVTVTFRDTTAGAQGEIQAVATLGNASVASGATGLITVVAGAPAYFTSSLPMGTSESVTAGSSAPVTFTAYDIYGNVVPDTLVAFSEHGLAGETMDGSSSYAGLTNANGQITVTFTPTFQTMPGSGQIEVQSLVNTNAIDYSGYIDYTSPDPLPTSYITAAGESLNLNKPGDTATVSGASGTTLNYAGAVGDFSTLSNGSATVFTPTIVSGSVTSGTTTVTGQVLAEWPTTSTYLDLTNETPGPGSTSGTAYVGYEFQSTSGPAEIWYLNSSGQLVSDGNTTNVDYLYVPVAQESNGVWSVAPQMTTTYWVQVNGTVYQFTVTQP